MSPSNLPHMIFSMKNQPNAFSLVPERIKPSNYVSTKTANRLLCSHVEFKIVNAKKYTFCAIKETCKLLWRSFAPNSKTLINLNCELRKHLIRSLTS